MSSSPAPACAANHTLEARPARANAGEAFQLRGGGFFVGCHDTGQRRPEPPDRDIRVDFRQDGQTWKLATVAADRNYDFNVKLAVPTEAQTGPARVIARGDSGQVAEKLVVVDE